MSSTHLATALVVPFEQLRMTDVESVGGKNASLGEMISQLAASGVRVPGGFATTAHAFRLFLKHNGLADPPTPAVYVSFAQRGDSAFNVAVKTSVSPESLMPAIRAELKAIDPTRPLRDGEKPVPTRPMDRCPSEASRAR